jgi:hypothetical protein
MLTAVVLVLGSCSSAGAPSASSASTASSSPSPTASSADEILTQAAAAAQGMKNYAFDMKLTQHLKGSSVDGNSNVQVDMQGRAELGPLKLDQTIKNDIDGQASTLRSILVPGAYYMYDPEFQEWSKLSQKDTTDMVKTLSDFQIDPSKSLGRLRALGGGLKAETGKERDTISYVGNGPEARAFLDSVLESTLDLSGMDAKVRQSIKLRNLRVALTLDPAKHWPVTYRIESQMTVEYEAGKPSTLDQTLAGTYSKPNGSSAVVVPDDAKKAPLVDSGSNNGA